MSSNTPIVRQTAWISMVPHFLIMGAIILIWYLVIPEKAIMYGALTYLLISFSLRSFIPRHHRKGMSHVRNQNFEDAISEFQSSYLYFSKNNWIDKYRFVTVLNSNKMSYKEMALNNIAFCYGQIGDGENARKFYQKTLDEFPDSGLAKAGLNMLNSMYSGNNGEL